MELIHSAQELLRPHRPLTAKGERAAKPWLTGGVFILLLAAVLVAVFPGITLGTRTFFYRDSGALGYPCGFYLRQCLARGELPLWNPYSHCGVPFMAQWGNWYPLNFLSPFFPMPWFSNVSILLHLLWGGYGMYWLSRRWGAGAYPAAFAGMAMVFNGVTFSCLIWGNYIASLAWVPWILGGVTEGWRQGGRWMVYAAAAAAMQVLTATPELTLLTWIVVGFLWASELPWKLARLLRLFGIVLLAAGLTMVQMLPCLDLLAHSQRDANYANTTWAMPGWGWANLLVPLFHCYQAPEGTWFQTGQEFLASYYLGTGVLVLAVLGAWAKHSRRNLIFAAMLLFCMIAALGPDGFLYSWLRRWVPFIGIARFPVKFAILPAALAPALAAWGVEALVERQAWRRRSASKVAQTSKSAVSPNTRLGGAAVVTSANTSNHQAQPSSTRSATRYETTGSDASATHRVVRPKGLVVAFAEAALVLMVLMVWMARKYPFPGDVWSATAWNAAGRAAVLVATLGGLLAMAKFRAPLLRRIAQLTVLAILPLDAVTHSPGISPTLPDSCLAPGYWSASGKPSAPKLGEGRILLTPVAEQQLLYSRVPDMGLSFAGKRLAEWYNLNLLDQAPKVTGAFTLRPAGFDLVERCLNSGTASPGLLDFLGVAWISSPTNAVQWVARATAMPALTAGQRPIFADDQTALREVTGDGFDPRQTVYLPLEARGKITAAGNTGCSVSQVRFEAGRVEAVVTAPAPSLMVLSQTYYHWWRACVDGKPAPLWPANVAFQALELPAGEHQVKLVYDDRSLRWGAVLSLCSAGVCALILLRRSWETAKD